MEQTQAHPAEVPGPSVTGARHRSPRFASSVDPDWTLSHCDNDSPSGTSALDSTLQVSCEHSMHTVT